MKQLAEYSIPQKECHNTIMAETKNLCTWKIIDTHSGLQQATDLLAVLQIKAWTVYGAQ